MYVLGCMGDVRPGEYVCVGGAAGVGISLILKTQ